MADAKRDRGKEYLKNCHYKSKNLIYLINCDNEECLLLVNFLSLVNIRNVYEFLKVCKVWKANPKNFMSKMGYRKCFKIRKYKNCLSF